MQNRTLNTAFNYHSFGSSMAGRNFSNSSYKYGWNGKENEKEIFEGCITFEARIYNSHLGRFLSKDPREEEYPWQSTYVYFSNSPISILDLLGMGAGDFYDVSGNYLGNDGLDDKKTYVADKKNTYGTFENAIELKFNGKSVSNDDLCRFANTIAGESSGNQKESYGIASAILNQGKEKKNKTLLQILKGQGKGSIFGFDINATSYTKKEYSMEAAINSLSGGKDVTNGATLWDGVEFWMLGNGTDNLRNTIKHNKFDEYATIFIKVKHFEEITKNIGTGTTTYKVNGVRKKFNNFNDCFYKTGKSINLNWNTLKGNSNKSLNLYSTLVSGKTIFWNPSLFVECSQ